MKVSIIETTALAISIRENKLFLKGQEYEVTEKVGNRLIELSVAKDCKTEKQVDPVQENKAVDPVQENKAVDPVQENKKRGRPPKVKK